MAPWGYLSGVSRAHAIASSANSLETLADFVRTSIDEIDTFNECDRRRLALECGRRPVPLEA